ncbi:unnamed protein product [Urochloa humidicola]
MESMQGEGRSRCIAHSKHHMECFTKREIERITNNYRTIIGRGAFGEVYRGFLENKTVVAVKRLVYNVRKNFDQELMVHREVNHKNVVRLIGYCVEEDTAMIVTEYISNGNLSGILHSDSGIPISLETRLRIATECAEALAYMHSYMSTQVIHGDIKPANILLDGSLKAKISDFGISRLINDPDKTLFTQNVMGSIGYMDPLFARDGCLTVKSDVYSFGVVMVELITRKTAATSAGKANIVDVFTKALANGVRRVRESFDVEIASQNNMKILEGVAKLAAECLRMERDRRPEMIDVVERLQTWGRAFHQGQQRVHLFSWARKSKPTQPALVTTTWPSGPFLCRQFSLEEMKAATRNFDESLRVLINPGDFDTRVYCGRIDGGATKVAITRPSHVHGISREEIEMMSKLRHGHIMPLIGYCDESSEMIMVYDFTTRGTLYHHLYKTQKQPLTWKKRLEICIGVARGLHYLYRGTKHAIIEGSLNSKNILLEETWVTDIIGGGLFDYFGDNWVSFLWLSFLEPENIYARRLAEEPDVRDFGALLFEILSAEVGRTLPKKYMLQWALRYKEEGRLNLFFDHALKGEINQQSLNKFAETAAKCVADQYIDRPSMEDVLSDLECALQLQVSAEARGSGS